MIKEKKKKKKLINCFEKIPTLFRENNETTYKLKN